MNEIYDYISNNTNNPNSQVASLLNYVDRHFHWKNLKYTWYNEVLKNFDSCSMVGEMKQYLSTQQKKTQTLKELEHHWQDYSKLTEILSDYIWSDEWMTSTVIANQTFRDSASAHRSLNHPYVNYVTWQNQKSNDNKW